MGGAIYLESPTTRPTSLTIKNSRFTRNTADEGGAIYFDSVSATIVNCLFDHNTATTNYGAFYGTNVYVFYMSVNLFLDEFNNAKYHF
jgi:predicted outer membrane repeat protein